MTTLKDMLQGVMRMRKLKPNSFHGHWPFPPMIEIELELEVTLLRGIIYDINMPLMTNEICTAKYEYSQLAKPPFGDHPLLS